MISSKRYDLRFLCRLSAIYKDQPNLNPENQHETPKNEGLEDYFPFQTCDFQAQNVSFQRCILIIKLFFWGGEYLFFVSALDNKKSLSQLLPISYHLHDPPW